MRVTETGLPETRGSSTARAAGTRPSHSVNAVELRASEAARPAARDGKAASTGWEPAPRAALIEASHQPASVSAASALEATRVSGVPSSSRSCSYVRPGLPFWRRSACSISHDGAVSRASRRSLARVAEAHAAGCRRRGDGKHRHARNDAVDRLREAVVGRRERVARSSPARGRAAPGLPGATGTPPPSSSATMNVKGRPAWPADASDET